MKYASSTLLFAEYIDQKDDVSTNQNDLIKTTLEFLITNEFVALVHSKEDGATDPTTESTYVCMCTMCIYVTCSELDRMY